MQNESGLAEKESYSELTRLQQDVVDAIVENPGATQWEIGDIAGTTQQTVSRVERNYGHIIDQRTQDDTDEIDEFYEDVESPGEETSANGGVVTEVDTDMDFAPQFFQDRPSQNQLTTEQHEFVEELDASDLEKKVIRTKLRNPDATSTEVAEMIEANPDTVATYMSLNRENIEEAFSIPYREEEKVEVTEENFMVTLTKQQVLDVLSSDVSREVKEEVFSVVNER